MNNPQRTGMTNIPCFHVRKSGSTHSIRLFGVLLYQWVRSKLPRLVLLLIWSLSCRETNLKIKHPANLIAHIPTTHTVSGLFIYLILRVVVGWELKVFFFGSGSSRISSEIYLTARRWVDEVSFVLVRLSLFADTIFVPARFCVEDSWSHSPNITWYWHYSDILTFVILYNNLIPNIVNPHHGNRQIPTTTTNKFQSRHGLHRTDPTLCCTFSLVEYLG